MLSWILSLLQVVCLLQSWGGWLCGTETPLSNCRPSELGLSDRKSDWQLPIILSAVQVSAQSFTLGFLLRLTGRLQETFTLSTLLFLKERSEGTKEKILCFSSNFLCCFYFKAAARLQPMFVGSLLRSRKLSPSSGHMGTAGPEGRPQLQLCAGFSSVV